jgi:hypothetical protein
MDLLLSSQITRRTSVSPVKAKKKDVALKGPVWKKKKLDQSNVANHKSNIFPGLHTCCFEAYGDGRRRYSEYSLPCFTWGGSTAAQYAVSFIPSTYQQNSSRK